MLVSVLKRTKLFPQVGKYASDEYIILHCLSFSTYAYFKKLPSNLKDTFVYDILQNNDRISVSAPALFDWFRRM